MASTERNGIWGIQTNSGNKSPEGTIERDQSASLPRPLRETLHDPNEQAQNLMRTSKHGHGKLRAGNQQQQDGHKDRFTRGAAVRRERPMPHTFGWRTPKELHSLTAHEPGKDMAVWKMRAGRGPRSPQGMARARPKTRNVLCRGVERLQRSENQKANRGDCDPTCRAPSNSRMAGLELSKTSSSHDMLGRT